MDSSLPSAETDFFVKSLSYTLSYISLVNPPFLFEQKDVK